MKTEVGKYRDQLGYTQRDMAKLLNVTEVTYGNKERGHNEFKTSEMFIISIEFKMPMEKIFKAMKGERK